MRFGGHCLSPGRRRRFWPSTDSRSHKRLISLQVRSSVYPISNIFPSWIASDGADISKVWVLRYYRRSRVRCKTRRSSAEILVLLCPTMWWPTFAKHCHRWKYSQKHPPKGTCTPVKPLIEQLWPFVLARGPHRGIWWVLAIIQAQAYQRCGLGQPATEEYSALVRFVRSGYWFERANRRFPRTARKHTA